MFWVKIVPHIGGIGMPDAEIFSGLVWQAELQERVSIYP